MVVKFQECPNIATCMLKTEFCKKCKYRRQVLEQKKKIKEQNEKENEEELKKIEEKIEKKTRKSTVKKKSKKKEEIIKVKEPEKENPDLTEKDIEEIDNIIEEVNKNPE